MSIPFALQWNCDIISMGSLHFGCRQKCTVVFPPAYCISWFEYCPRIPGQRDVPLSYLDSCPLHFWRYSSPVAAVFKRSIDLFKVLYSVGIVELELESTSALVLLLFVIPLAFTLSGFMLWIMYALNGTTP